MIKPTRTHIEHIAVFIVVFGITAFAIAEFLEMEFTDPLWLFLLFLSLIVTGFFFAFRKKHAKAGHIPLIAGLYLLILGGGMFVGSVERTHVNQFGEDQSVEKLWELSQRNAGLFIVILIAGLVAIFIGIRIAIQNAYFWTWKAWAVIGVTVIMIGITAWSLLNQ